MVKKFSIPLFIISILNILINSFLIHALRRLKKLNTISFKFILLLSISDICYGITWTVYLSMTYTTYEANNWLIFVIAVILAYFFSLFSGAMILLIALDRYIHMKFSLRYNMIMTKRRAVSLVVGLMFTSMILTIIELCARLFDFVFIAHVTLNVLLAIGSSCLFTLYLKAYRSVQRQTEQMNLDRSMPSRATQRRNPCRELSRASFAIFASLIICYTPYSICSTVSHYGYRDESKLSVNLEFAFLCFVHINPSSNAIIFIALNRDLRGFLKNFLKLRFSENGVEM